MANTEKDEAATMTTVMAVAMAGKAIRPSLDVLQQLVKAQRENVSEIISDEQAQIRKIKEQLNDEVRRNDELEAKCLDMEDKVRLVLQNHKMVQESLARSYGYNRIELWPAEIDLHFEKELYERMMSQLYEEPQYIAALLRRAEPAEVDQLVEVVVNQLYANHYKARDEYYILSLILHLLTDEMASVTEPLHILADVGVATKLLSAYTRRGPNLEALKTALFKPMSLVLSRKKLELEVEPTAVYAAQLEELRFKSDTELRADVTAAEAWALPEVKRIVQARIRNLVEVAELFLTRIIAVRGVLPYGVRAIARKIYSTTADRFPRATDGEKMRGVANFVFVTFFCPAIIHPQAFDLCSHSNRPTAPMKRNLVRIASTLKLLGSLTPTDGVNEPWYSEIGTLVHNSSELMRQFYSNLCDVPEVDEQRRVTMYMESTESLTPVRTLQLNAVFLLHAVLYRNSVEILSGADNPLYNVLLELGNMPDQVSDEQNRLVLLRLRLRPRDDFFTSGTGADSGETAIDSLAELRQKLLDCLRDAPTVNLRHGETLTRSMEELLRECKRESRFEAAAKAQRVIELLELTGTAADGQGEGFLQEAADEISKRARHRVQLAKERQDLTKIVAFVQNHNDAVRRKFVAFEEYLEAVRDQKVTVKNVYTTEAMQRGDKEKKKKKVDAEAQRKEAEERRKVEGEKVRAVMNEHPNFKKLCTEDPGLNKYLESHPNLTKAQMRDLLDRRPDFVAVFDRHPEELIKIGRAPELRKMLDQNKELKAALDKKSEVREILESNPDMNRSQLNDLVFSNAQLKDLYDSRPELKEILQTRARLFEDEMKSLEEQKPEEFVAGPLVSVSCRYLVKAGVLTSVALPPKMVAKLTFEFSSVRSGTTHVLAMWNGKAALAFDLQLEELLEMQRNKTMVKEQGKIKLDVNKTLEFLNEKMRF